MTHIEKHVYGSTDGNHIVAYRLSNFYQAKYYRQVAIYHDDAANDETVTLPLRWTGIFSHRAVGFDTPKRSRPIPSISTVTVSTRS